MTIFSNLLKMSRVGISNSPHQIIVSTAKPMAFGIWFIMLPLALIGYQRTVHRPFPSLTYTYIYSLLFFLLL